MWDEIVFGLSPHLPKGTNPYNYNPYRKKRTGGQKMTAQSLREWAEDLRARNEAKKRLA